MGIRDTPIFDAGLDDVVMYSHGDKLIGGFYRGAGTGLRPTAMLLHGVPGVEKNLDIAYALRREGWNCLYFHFRGSWGSGGEYEFGGSVDDTRAAIEWLIEQPSVDPSRLAVVGNSFGGYVAIAATAAEPRLRATVAITPLIDPSTVQLSTELFSEFASMLNGVTGRALRQQWKELPSALTLKERLDGRPLLLVTADEDAIFPVSHYQVFAEEIDDLTWLRIDHADHVFSNDRGRLVEATVEWLIQTLGR